MKNPRLLRNQAKVLRRVLQKAVELTGAHGGAIMFRSPDTRLLEVEAVHGGKKPRFRMSEAEKVAGSGKMFRSCGARARISMSSQIRAELAVPLEQEGQGVGLLYVNSTRENVFGRVEEKELSKWAAESVEWLKIVWELNQLRVKGRQLEALVNMGQAIVSQDVLPQVLQRVTWEACRLMKACLSSILLLSDDGEELLLEASHGASEAYLRKPPLSVNESLIGTVLRRRKPMSVLDVRQDKRYQYTRLAKKEKLVSFLAVPLVFKEQALGILSVYTDKLHRFSDEEIRLLSAMAGLSAVSIARAQWLEKVARVEEELKTAERLSALGWLAAEVAHEIRNPLAVMQMLFHSLTQSLPLKGESARDAAIIQEKMRQMNRIVEQVLTFSRSSEPVMESIDARAVMEDISLLVRHKLAEQNIHLRNTVPENLPPIRGDRAQLEQAILNLVLNACQAMPKGGTLTLSAQTKGKNILLLIKDTGKGIPTARKKDLFQPFISHQRSGTGIGLALVSRVVQTHRGEISYQSRKGRGTAFQISLPVEESEH